MKAVNSLAEAGNLDQFKIDSWLTEGTATVTDSFEFNQRTTTNEDDSRSNKPNLDFFLTNVYPSMVIYKCLPFRYNKNFKEYYKMIQYKTKQKIKRDAGKVFHSMFDLKMSDYQDYKLVNELQEKSSSENKNPDTLDDSDIENLIDDDEEVEDNKDDKEESDQDENFKQNVEIEEDETDPDKLDENTVISEYEDDLCLASTDSQPEDMKDVVDSYILVAEKYFYLVGSHIIHRMFEYVDIATFRPISYPTEESKFTIWDDRILAITTDGYFIAMVMSRMDSNYYKDFTARGLLGPNKVTQYWKLKLNKSWKIVTSPYHNFVAVVQHTLTKGLEDSNGLTIKLFHWVSAVEFKLVNSIILPSKYDMVSSVFMPSQQPTLAVGIGNDKTAEIGLIQWNNNTFEVEETVIVKTTLYSLAILIPISETHLLISTIFSLTCLVSLDDLYEKRYNPFTTTMYCWRDTITSWFPDNNVLTDLLSVDSQYDKFDHCIFVANKKKQIFCLLCRNNSEEIDLYLVEENITGLTSIAPCSNQNTAGSHLFNILMTRYNECKELTIDFTKMKKMSREQSSPTYYDFKDIGSTNKAIVAFNTICSVSPEYISGFISLDHRNEVWVTSCDTISQVQPLPFVFTRQSYQMTQTASDFREFCYIKYITGNEMFGTKLIWAQDKENNTKCYTIESELVYDHSGKVSNQVQFVELDDLLPPTNEQTLFVHIYETFATVVTTSEILLKSFEYSFEVQSIFNAPEDLQISNVEFKDHKLIFWDQTHAKVWCIDNLSLGVNAQCHEIIMYNKLLLNRSNISFHMLNSADSITVILRNETGLYSTPWKDFISNNFDNITLVKYIPISDFVMCNKDLCVFLYYNNSGKPMLRITNMSANKVVVWDRVTTAFKPSEKVHLKKLNESSIACYSSNHFFLIFLNDVNDIICEEILFPYVSRTVQILDVEYDQPSQTMFCLFDDGLRRIKLTYLSQFKSCHFLPEPKKIKKPSNKIYTRRRMFYYLKKLNRVLIVSPNRFLWYLMKLENGSIIWLKNNILEDVKYSLQQILEVEHKGPDTLLLLKFQNCIKYVKFSVTDHKIHVKQMDQYMSNFLYPAHDIKFYNKRDSFILIQSDRTCLDSDTDVCEPNYSGYASTSDPYTNTLEAVGIYTEFRINENKITFTNKKFFDIFTAFMMSNLSFLFENNLFINTHWGVASYDCDSLNEKIPMKMKSSDFNITRIGKDMILAKKSHLLIDSYSAKDRREIIYQYKFAFVDEIVSSRSKFFFEDDSTKFLETSGMFRPEEVSSKPNQDCSLNAQKEILFEFDEMDSIWSDRICHDTSLNYYGGENLSGIYPRLETKTKFNLANYIAGLPQVFPQLNGSLSMLKTFSLHTNSIYKAHFDAKENSLYVVTSNNTIYQFKNTPIAVSTCNAMPLKPDDLINAYIEKGDIFERKLSFDIETREKQGFVWKSF